MTAWAVPTRNSSGTWKRRPAATAFGYSSCAENKLHGVAVAITQCWMTAHRLHKHGSEVSTRASRTLLALFVVMKIRSLLCGLVSRHRSVHASVLPRLTSLP